MNKIVYFFKYGFTAAVQQWSFQLMRGFLYTTIVAMWAYVWSMAPQATWDKLGITWAHMVWYVVIAEIVIFTGPNSHRAIENDLREGRFQTHFARPMSWIQTFYAQEGGAIPFNILTIGACGLALGMYATHDFPFTTLTFLMMIVHVILASMIWLSMIVCVGLTALWMGSSNLAYWLLQKSGFILGGLLLPIFLYPGWLNAIAWMTPFPSIFYIPAQMVLPTSHSGFLINVAVQIAVLIAVNGLMLWLYSRFENKLLREG